MNLVSPEGAGATLVIASTILGFLFVDQIRLHRMPAIQRFLTNHLRSITQQGYAGLSARNHFFKRIFHSSLFLTYITFWGLYILLFAKYFFLLQRLHPTPSWTFGQIVAITVWAPALFEYGNLEIREFCSCSNLFSASS